MYLKGEYMLDKMKDMWNNLKTPFKVFLVMAACILMYALITNYF